MTPVRIPQRIDEPPHFLLWSLDEIAPLLVGMFFGVMLEQMAICLLIGYIVTQAYKKYRDSHPDGFLLHMLYWAGMPITKSKCFKNPYARNYIP